MVIQLNIQKHSFRVGESANEEIAEKLQANGESANGVTNPAYVSGTTHQIQIHSFLECIILITL